MNTDTFPLSAMDSLNEYVKHLKVVMKGWTIKELVIVRDQWEHENVPKECLKAVQDEIYLRDKLNERIRSEGAAEKE